MKKRCNTDRHSVVRVLRKSLLPGLLISTMTLSTGAMAAPDKQAPTAPGGLTATANSGSQISLGWTASTDNVGVTGYLVERCTGSGCTSFVQIATTTTITYVNTGLGALTTYRYRVRAKDAANNLSAYSAIASATTTDSQAPTAPANLAFTFVTDVQIGLAWSASTDNVAVTGYLIERCQGSPYCTTFTQVGTSSGTQYTDSGLTPVTSYRYRVRARDAVPNYSDYSNSNATTTPAPPDTTPPTAPSGLTAIAASNTQIKLSWVTSEDNVAVTGYSIERCAGTNCSNFQSIGSVTDTKYNDMGLTNGTAYSYRVRARDAIPNYSGYSNTASATAAVTEVNCD